MLNFTKRKSIYSILKQFLGIDIHFCLNFVATIAAPSFDKWTGFFLAVFSFWLNNSGLSWRFRKKFFERSKNETFACSLANLRISSSANWKTGPLLSWFSILGIIETRRRWAPGVSLMLSTTCLTNLIKFETYHCSQRKLLEPLKNGSVEMKY